MNFNPFSILGQLPASNSPRWTFNSLDAKKIGRECLIALIPVLTPVLASAQGHSFVFNGTDYTLPISIGIWLVLQFFRRLASGQPKTAS